MALLSTTSIDQVREVVPFVFVLLLFVGLQVKGLEGECFHQEPRRVSVNLKLRLAHSRFGLLMPTDHRHRNEVLYRRR